MSNKPIGDITVLTSWEDLRKYHKEAFVPKMDESPQSKSPKWIFRGDKYNSENYSNAENHRYAEDTGSLCRTSLERACDAYGIRPEERLEREKDMIRDFQRKLHLHTPYTPARNDLTEWLALMQHHFAPTRLLDWTYSFYVAAYFALAELDCCVTALDPRTSVSGLDVDRCGRRDVAEIWAVESRWFSDEAENALDQDEIDRISFRIRKEPGSDYMDDLGVRHNAIVHHLLVKPTSLVYAINPFRLNQRLTIQQGVFLLTGDTRQSFMANLQSGVYGDGTNPHVRRIRLPVTADVKCSIMQELHNANVTNASLFPGLDGFARSMKERLAFPLRSILSQSLSRDLFLSDFD